MKRIEPLDGLRTCAVLGVLWAHVWMFFKNIPFPLAGVDINRLLAFGGIGVDLFFVISGFCMYLMYAKKVKQFNFESYGSFFVKRWRRIAPAFYAVVLVDCFIYLVSTGVFPFNNMLAHFFFINTITDYTSLSPSFWSLATEWHFYLILPFLFIRLKTPKEFMYRVFFLMAISMVTRIVLFSDKSFLQNVTLDSDMIWYRFIEFGWGLLAALFYTQQGQLPGWLKGNMGFIFSFIIAFSGRLLMTSDVLLYLGKAASIGRALGEPVLTFGFGLMVLNVVLSPSIFANLLSSKPFLFIGRISYSMYLWHWMIAINVSGWVIAKFGISQLNFYMCFFAITILLIPVAYISYKLLEEPYFKKSHKNDSTRVKQSNVVFAKTD